MSIPVLRPEIQVTVFKLSGVANGQAYRYQTSQSSYDLTQFLGDAGAVRTVKQMDAPTGAFSISFADKEDPTGLDTIYGLVEPMDMVEIRMSHAANLAAGAGQFPLVMRGFVSSLQRDEALGGDGTPQRVVVIRGHDFGKLWQIHQLLPENVLTSNSPYLSIYRLQAATGIGVEYQAVNDFMTTFTQQVMNLRVRELEQWASGASVPEFQVRASVPDGLVSPGLISPFQGPYWNLLETVCDRPWNELFIQDEEAGPVLIFRPAPYRDADGSLIINGAQEPGTIVRDQEDVVAISVQRGDSRLGNFFWVPPGSSLPETTGMANVASLQSGRFQDFEHGNNAPQLFGIRKMTANTALMPNDLVEGITPRRVTPGNRMAAGDTVINWHIKRAEDLKLMNRDNVALESVQLTLKGSEEFQVGKYLRLTRGQRYGTGMTSEGYITSVSHTFSALRNYTTTVTLERGNGFLVRDATGGRPYWLEGRRGPYTAG